jgi:hypothetical protein
MVIKVSQSCVRALPKEQRVSEEERIRSLLRSQRSHFCDTYMLELQRGVCRMYQDYVYVHALSTTSELSLKPCVMLRMLCLRDAVSICLCVLGALGLTQPWMHGKVPGRVLPYHIRTWRTKKMVVQ